MNRSAPRLASISPHALAASAGIALLLALAPPKPAEAEQPPLLVFAAASLTNALDELGKSYAAETGQPVKFSFAASSTLARQIEAGAKADVFLSADTQWADYLQRRNLLNPNSRADLLGNRLVLIAPADGNTQLAIGPNFALNKALGSSRLSIGDPDSVPAGKYARAALISLGVWHGVANKLVLGDSVRSTLAFVDRGEAPLGIVYQTDAFIDKHVRIVDTFPANTHPAIVYPVALTANAKDGAAAFVDFLRAPASQSTFKKYGFAILHHPDRHSNLSTKEER